MEARSLAASRHALIKVLHLEPGVTVRMEDHIITSVVDAQGRERWENTPPTPAAQTETIVLPGLPVGLRISTDRDALAPDRETSTVFLPPGSDPMTVAAQIRQNAADWQEFLQILGSAPGIPGVGVPLHYQIAWPENEFPHPHLATPPEVFDEADAKARIKAHRADPREPDDEALVVVPQFRGCLVWARRWDATHFSSLEDFMMQVAFVKRRRKAVDFFGSIRSHEEMSADWGLVMLQHIEGVPFYSSGSVLRGAVLVDLDSDFIEFGSVEWFAAYTGGFVATRFVFDDEKQGRALKQRLWT